MPFIKNSYINTSDYYAVSKWTGEILNPVRKLIARYSIKDSFSIVEMVENMNLSEMKVASLDV